ncbi:MAG TPA: tripartite tricarboxylate transporter TctB family protein [Burkholderiales bacterium]|jgi:putative tricarboxylic transport membrane protein|nr:tripartite tricarboxylate transporter TctB family protein [Burkholderiales bacterium]
MKLRIKGPKDFWAGLMFIGFGGFFMVWAMTHYQMGTAVRMGPAYFPTVLGGLLVFLGILVLIESFAMEGPPLTLPFNIVHLVFGVLLYFVLGWVLKRIGMVDYAILAGTLVLVVLSVLFRPATKPLVLISAACVIYGYLMKPFGLILATLFLVFIAAFAGHEFKWKEVTILYVILIVFSLLVFVKGLTLPFPICPAFVENCPIR